VPVGADGVTPAGALDAVVNKSAEDVLRRLPVRPHNLQKLQMAPVLVSLPPRSAPAGHPDRSPPRQIYILILCMHGLCNSVTA